MAIGASAASIIGGGLGTLGSLASSAANVYLQGQQQKWAERMANTAHQREMRDLKRAGINPILTATGGRGAESPTVAPARVDNPFVDLGSGITSAGRINALELPRLANESAVASAQVAEAKSRTELNEQMGFKVNADTALAVAEELLTREKFSALSADKEFAKMKQELLRLLQRTLADMAGPKGTQGTLFDVLKRMGGRIGDRTDFSKEIYEWVQGRKAAAGNAAAAGLKAMPGGAFTPPLVQGLMMFAPWLINRLLPEDSQSSAKR